MKDYTRLVSIAEPLSYLQTRLSDVSMEVSTLDARALLLKHVEQHLMGFQVQPENLSIMLQDVLPTDLKNEITEVTHDMIHRSFYRFNQDIDGDRVVGVSLHGDDAYVLVEPTEEINQMVDQFEDMYGQY